MNTQTVWVSLLRWLRRMPLPAFVERITDGHDQAELHAAERAANQPPRVVTLGLFDDIAIRLNNEVHVHGNVSLLLAFACHGDALSALVRRLDAERTHQPARVQKALGIAYQRIEAARLAGGNHGSNK